MAQGNEQPLKRNTSASARYHTSMSCVLSPSLQSSAQHTITADADEPAAWGVRGGASSPQPNNLPPPAPIAQDQNCTARTGWAWHLCWFTYTGRRGTLWKEAFSLKSIQEETTQFYAHFYKYFLSSELDMRYSSSLQNTCSFAFLPQACSLDTKHSLLHKSQWKGRCLNVLAHC